MAMIFCGKCQNEYDNNVPVCPYCNYPTPKTENIKNNFRVLLVIGIVVLVALPFLRPDAEDDLKTWFADVTGYEFSQSSTDIANDEGITAELQGIASESNALTRYVMSANALLNTVATNVSIPQEFLDAPSGRTLAYTIYKDAMVQVTLTDDGSVIESVVVSNISNRSYKNEMQNVVAALIAGVSPSSMTIEDVKPQLAYLHQLALESPECSVYYDYEGYYLAENYHSGQKLLSISLSENVPNDGC